MLNAVELIVLKRNGEPLPGGALRRLVDGYMDGSVPDYQMSAFLMAAFLNGLDESETRELLGAMLESGEVLDLSDIPGAKVDKHSTGGVGDKVSLVVAPLVASCGLVVPMISGRGLGHTGGTLDKLEAIPGLRTDLDTRTFKRQLERLGVAMIGQTDEIAVADRGLYALRDVTGTVESIPLIAASIMSKKLAEGLDGLVLDVKCGRGAFMEHEPAARRLAQALSDLGDRHGCPTVALLTSMDDPLGRAVGNWGEVVEAVECLRGGGPPDLRELSLALAGEMLHMGGAAPDRAAGTRRAERALDDGSAFDRFRAMVAAQGGDPASLDRPGERSAGAFGVDVIAEHSGFVERVDAREIGAVCVAIGAGRTRKEDPVDPLAGILLNKKPGDPVGSGESLARILVSDPERADGFGPRVRSAFGIGSSPPPITPLVRDRYAAGRWSGPAA